MQAESISEMKRPAFFGSSVKMASVWPEVNFCTEAIAASRESTTSALIIKSRYSVSKSSSVAGSTFSHSPRTASVPRTSTPDACKSAMMACSASVLSLCTHRFSTALHTPGRWTLALLMHATVPGRLQVASTYMLHSPRSCLSTGTDAFSVTVRTRPWPPRGTMRSTYWSRRIIC